VVAHSNSLIYEKFNTGSTAASKVHMLPDPEEPVELAFKNIPEEDVSYDSIDDILAKIELGEENDTLPLAESETPSSDTTSSSKIVTEGSNLYDMEEPKDLKKDETQEDFKEQQDDHIVSMAPRQVAANIDNITSSNIKITTLPEEKNKLYNLNMSSKDSGYKIHLSSSWSEKEARAEWQKIQARHVKYLKNAELIIKKVKANNGKIIYLILAGNFPSVNQAKLICKKLTASKQNCIVTK
jgi:hypothetical protein